MPTKARNVSRHHPDLSADKAPLIDYSQANLHSKPVKRLFCYLLFCYFLFSRVELSGLIEKNGEKFGGLTFIHLLCRREKEHFP